MKRFIGLILALVVAGGFAVASQARSASGHDGQPGVELTYTKWFAPTFPNMVGDVGGDIVGKFGGAVSNGPWPAMASPPTSRRSTS